MNAPLPIPPTWTTGSTAAIKTGTWRAALAKHVQAPSPCHVACPVHGDIAEWIGQARARDFHAAWQTLSRHNPFPAVIGRICHHPCESACNRGLMDASVGINAVERFLGDEALKQGWQFDKPKEQSGKRVLVVGAGPSGLSAAYQLGLRGHEVVIHEAGPVAGGMMRFGIPTYRLPRAVLEAEIARITALGVEIRLDTKVSDLLEESALGEGRFAFGLRAAQLAGAAISFDDVFVLQSAASNLLQLRSRVERGLRYAGPALFSIYAAPDGAGRSAGDRRTR